MGARFKPMPGAGIIRKLRTVSQMHDRQTCGRTIIAASGKSPAPPSGEMMTVAPTI